MSWDYEDPTLGAEGFARLGLLLEYAREHPDEIEVAGARLWERVESVLRDYAISIRWRRSAIEVAHNLLLNDIQVTSDSGDELSPPEQMVAEYVEVLRRYQARRGDLDQVPPIEAYAEQSSIELVEDLTAQRDEETQGRLILPPESVRRLRLWELSEDATDSPLLALRFLGSMLEKWLRTSATGPWPKSRCLEVLILILRGYGPDTPSEMLGLPPGISWDTAIRYPWEPTIEDCATSGGDWYGHTRLGPFFVGFDCEPGSYNASLDSWISVILVKLGMARAVTSETLSGASADEEETSPEAKPRTGGTPLTLPLVLNNTDTTILDLLEKDPQKRLKTDEIATALKRDLKSIGKNLSKLKKAGLIENPGRQGFARTDVPRPE